MENKLTMGSLFDGSGGFPLGGILNDITPVWASEIEPFPIRVTSKRIPGMKHYGNICAINGADIEPVDIITFGSPCTDMSVAGRRAGLDGKQSVLFYEAIRIVKEMRCKTNGEYPRYIVWENVPGAFSSNSGEDFKAVLEAVIGVVRPETPVPAPENGRWPYADCYVGDGWSVAYRTIDAQYFGVPQRRRRIYLVADFGSERAGEILFKPQSLPGDPAKGCDTRQGPAANSATSPGVSGIVLNDQGGSSISFSHDTAATLRAQSHGHPPCVLQGVSSCTDQCKENRGGEKAVAIENHPTDSRVKIDESGTVQTLTSRMGTGGMNVPLVMSERTLGLPVTENIAQTLMGTDYKGVQCVCEATPKTLKVRSGREGGCKGALVQGDLSATLGCNNDQTLFVPAVFGISSDKSNGMLSDNPSSSPASFYPYMKAESQCFRTDGTANTLINGTNPGCQNGIMDSEFTVRRLTPTECARLQGFPDQWCHGLESAEPSDEEISVWQEIFETWRMAMGKTTKPRSRKQVEKWLRDPYSDAAEYKVWGNGVALPCVYFVLKGIAQLSSCLNEY